MNGLTAPSSATNTAAVRPATSQASQTSTDSNAIAARWCAGAGNAGGRWRPGPGRVARDQDAQQRRRRAVLRVVIRCPKTFGCRTWAIIVLLIPSLAAMLFAAGSIRAQGPVYTAQPPTRGALYADGQTDRYLLGGAWLYRSDRADVGIAESWWRGVAATDGWSPVAVPNAYNAGDFSSASMNGYVGWYRRDFTLPAGAFPSYVPTRFQHWIIRFESVNYHATVWLNGHEIGSHDGAYLPFEFDLRGLRRGVNRLIVRVDNRLSRVDVPSTAVGWWNFGGLLREVYLRAAARADLSQVQVRPTLPCPQCAATVQFRVAVRNVTRARQTVHLRGSYGRVRVDFGSAVIGPGLTWTANATIVIAHPRLWSIDGPHLYRSTLTLLDAKARPIGGYVTQSGIRSIKVRRGRLTLNGRLLNLRGVALHEQDIASGAALSQADIARLIGWIRAVGAHLIRAHYPLNPQIEEAADRYGILIWSEIPVWRVNSAYLAKPAFLAHALAMLRANILTNQNHPSVLLWSIGNELNANRSGRNYIRVAASLAHRLDPTRPVGIAGAGPPCTAAYAPLDALGASEYFGWFDAQGGATDDRDALSPSLDRYRACYPNKALFVTEFGVDGNRYGPVEERGTYEFQSNTLAYDLAVFATKQWLSGAVDWILQDWVSWPGWAGDNPRGNPPFVTNGLFDLFGHPKPAFSVVSTVFHATREIAPLSDVRLPVHRRRAHRSGLRR
jgi:beta-glucuronidase